MSDTLPTADPLALLQHRAWVRALARRIVADENAVDDVEQDTWAAALRSGPDEPRALRTWLGRVASRFALQRLRGDGRRARREAEIAMAQGDGGTGPAAAPTSDVVAEADLHGHVVQAVLALDEPYRTTILLRYFEGLAIADVAARMDVPVETVRTRLRRAHERLRARLEREHARSASALLAPLAAAESAPAPVAAPAGLGLGAALVGSAAIVAAVVGIVALGGWALGRLTAPGSEAGRAAGVVFPQQAPPPVPPGAPADPPQVVPPPDAPVEDRCVVRDLWDGKPVAGLELTIAGRRGDATAETVAREEPARVRPAFYFNVTTDAAGRIPVKLLDGDVVLVPWRAGDPRWSPTIAKKANEPAPREIWVARKITVRGRVRSASADDPWKPERAEVRVELSPVGMDWTSRPIGFPVLDHHFFDGRTTMRTVSTVTAADGAFEVEVPLIAGAVVQVSAAGRVAMVKPLAEGVEYDFALQPMRHLRGRLVDAAGAPLLCRKVRVRATAGPRDGSAPVWSEPTGAKARLLPDGRTSMDLECETVADGRFAFEVADTWDLALDVQEPGLRRVVRSIGTTTSDTDVEIRAEPAADADRRAIRIGGVSSGAAILHVGERCEAGRSWTATVGDDGHVDTSWFVPGRDYELRLFRPVEGEPLACRPLTPENAPRLVRWTGADLDWDTLPLLDAATPGTGK